MTVAEWTSTGFLSEARAWVQEGASRHGLTLVGEPEQPHARPWSSALRFGSDAGPLWFKVNGTGTRYESALLATLTEVAPTLGPDVLASEAARGWTLMRDAGPALRSTAPAEDLWGAWTTILTGYADAQLALADHVDALVAAGTPVVSAATLPGQLRALVAELAARPVQAGGLEADQVRRLESLFPSYDAWCSELATSGLPETLNHDDLHSNNVCVGATGTRIIDWGDAVVGHPFGTMLATLNSVAHHTGLEVGDTRVKRLRDAYLERFDAYGSRKDRKRWVKLARRTGAVTRALCYGRALEGTDPAEQAAFDWPVRGWLLELLDEA